MKKRFEIGWDGAVESEIDMNRLLIWQIYYAFSHITTFWR